MSRLIVFVSFLAFACSAALAQAQVCEVSDQMTKDQKLPCVRSAKIVLDQPTLTPTQLANGPDFDPADPEKSRYAYFTEADNIFHSATRVMPLRRRQHEIQCNMTRMVLSTMPRGEPSNRRHRVVVDKTKPESPPRCTPQTTPTTYNESTDHFKVKYLKPPYPNHDTRFNGKSSQSQPPASWGPGFRRSRHPVGSASRIGCGSILFQQSLRQQSSQRRPATKEWAPNAKLHGMPSNRWR